MPLWLLGSRVFEVAAGQQFAEFHDASGVEDQLLSLRWQIEGFEMNQRRERSWSSTPLAS